MLYNIIINIPSGISDLGNGKNACLIYQRPVNEILTINPIGMWGLLMFEQYRK